jgi:hypothetical protein
MTPDVVTIRHIDSDGRLVHAFSKMLAGQMRVMA